MDVTVGSHDVRLVRRKLIPFKVCHLASCFFNDQVPSRAIPGLQFVFIKSIKPSCCHPAKISGSRSEPTNGDSFSYQLFKYLQWAVWHIQVSIREAGYKAGINYILFLAYPDLLVV